MTVGQLVKGQILLKRICDRADELARADGKERTEKEHLRKAALEFGCTSILTDEAGEP